MEVLRDRPPAKGMQLELVGPELVWMVLLVAALQDSEV